MIPILPISWILIPNSAFIFPSTSARSLSSSAISFMMSAGLRWVISSPPSGFFTERSKVALSMSATFTFQLLGESAKVFWSLMNSAR